MIQKISEETKLGDFAKFCLKTCGSGSCRGAIKFSTPDRKICPGVGVGCLATKAKTPQDKTKANEWITKERGGGDRNWLNRQGSREINGHLTNREYTYKPFFVQAAA